MESYFLWHNIVFFLCMCKEQSKSLSIARWKTTIGAINKGNKTWMIHRSMKVYFEYTKIFLWWFFSILQKMFWFFFSQIPFLINHFPKYFKKKQFTKNYHNNYKEHEKVPNIFSNFTVWMSPNLAKCS